MGATQASFLPSCRPTQAQSSCPVPLDPSSFLSPEFLLPEDAKSKHPAAPLLQYPPGAEGPGLEPRPRAPFQPLALPSTLLPEEPVFSPQFPFPSVPPAQDMSPLPAPTAFPPTQALPPGPSPTRFPLELLPSGYAEPPFGPHFALPQELRPRGKPPAPNARGHKPSTPNLAPLLAGGPVGSTNPCLARLLTAGETRLSRQGEVRGARSWKIQGAPSIVLSSHS